MAIGGKGLQCHLKGAGKIKQRIPHLNLTAAGNGYCWTFGKESQGLHAHHNSNCTNLNSNLCVMFWQIFSVDNEDCGHYFWRILIGKSSHVKWDIPQKKTSNPHVFTWSWHLRVKLQRRKIRNISFLVLDKQEHVNFTHQHRRIPPSCPWKAAGVLLMS